MFRAITATAAAIVLGGCAANPATQDVAAAAPKQEAVPASAAEAEVLARTESSTDDADRVICRQITPTGSHRKKTICRKVSDIRSDRNSAQDAMRSQQGATISGPGN